MTVDTQKAELDLAAIDGSEEKSGGAVNFLMEWFAVLLLGVVTVLVLGNAVSRYTLNMPLPWAEEVVINMMVWLGAAGMVIATMRGALITCDIVTGRLSPRTARIVAVSCTVFSAVVMAIFTYLTWQYLMVFGGDRTPVLRIPKAWVISGLLFTTAGVTLALVASLRRR
jgi:TRAP-type C4-dicarboxylate transport system permease small subunit